MIKINNYFFNPTGIKIEIEEKGKTRRTFNDTLHTQYSGRHRIFKYAFSNSSPVEVSHFLHLNNLCKPDNPLGEAVVGGEDLTLIDTNGKQYNVSIPINGLQYTPEPGKEESYEVNLTLEEV